MDDNTADSSGTTTSGTEYTMNHEAEHSPMSFMLETGSVPIRAPLKDKPMHSLNTSSDWVLNTPARRFLLLGSCIPNPACPRNIAGTGSTPTSTATDSRVGSSPSQVSLYSETPLHLRRGQGPNHNQDRHHRLHPTVMKSGRLGTRNQKSLWCSEYV